MHVARLPACCRLLQLPARLVPTVSAALCSPGADRFGCSPLAGLTVLTFSNAHTHHRNAPPYPYMNYKVSPGFQLVWCFLVVLLLLLPLLAAAAAAAVLPPPPLLPLLFLRLQTTLQLLACCAVSIPEILSKLLSPPPCCRFVTSLGAPSR